MFTSDRKLARKAGSRSSSHASASREQILAKAQAERLQRERLRSLSQQTVMIQRWYRGRRAAARLRGALRAEFDAKLRDINAVRAALAAQGVPFAVPVAVAAKLLAMLVHFCSPLVPGDRQQLDQFCDGVVLPAMHSADTRLHLTAALANGPPEQQLRLKRLMQICVEALLQSALRDAHTAGLPGVAQVSKR